MKKYLFVYLILSSVCFSQNPEWINYTSEEKIFSLVSSGNYLWISSHGGGLIRFNKTTEQFTYFYHANANLPDNHIRDIAIDSSGNVWVGTQFSGIGKFNGSMCQVFNEENSQLPFNQWNDPIEVDPVGNIWVGTYGGYISKFDAPE